MKKQKEIRIGGAKVSVLPSGSYHVRLSGGFDSKGNRVIKSITNKDIKELQRQALAWLADDAKREASENKDMTVEQAITKYIETCKTAGRSPSTIAGYNKLKRIGYPMLINKKIKSITASIVQDQINLSAKIHSPKTVSNEYGLLHKVIMTYAPSIDLSSIVLPTKDNIVEEDEVVIQSDDEIRLLLTESKKNDPALYLAIILGAILGMRRSEICALDWGDYNQEEKTIKITKAMVRDEDRIYRIKAPKSKKGRRVLPVPTDVASILESYKKEAGNIVDATPDAITRRYERLRDSIGAHGRFHDLRHYHCSIMVALNVPEPYIMADMGHSTNNLYKKVYTHLRGDKFMDIYSSLDTQASTLISQD